MNVIARIRPVSLCTVARSHDEPTDRPIWKASPAPCQNWLSWEPLAPWVSALGPHGSAQIKGPRFVIRRIFRMTPCLRAFKAKLEPPRWQELSRKLIRSQDQDPSSILSDAPGGTVAISEFWLYDSRMPSPSDNFRAPIGTHVDLARWTPLLLRPASFLKSVSFLQHLLKELRQNEDVGLSISSSAGTPRASSPVPTLMLGSEMLTFRFPYQGHGRMTAP